MVYLVSDSYIGLDQQYDFTVFVHERPEGSNEQPRSEEEPDEGETKREEEGETKREAEREKPKKKKEALLHIESGGKKWGDDSDSDAEN